MSRRHHASVEFLPRMGLWIAWCNICGQIGMGERYEADAWAIVDRHHEINGLEKRS